MPRHTILFTGRVQGVGFRYATRQLAEDHPVAGYVQNLPDGRVLLVAEGAAPALAGFLEALDRRMGQYIRHKTFTSSEATNEFGPPAPGALTIRH